VRDAEARDRVAKLEALLEGLEALDDPVARDRAMEMVQALVELYGAGLERIVEQVAERDEGGELADAMAGDELVSHLLLLHDLHPVPLEARVRGALEQVRPYLESHGGNVELLEIDEDVVRLRMEGSCSGCPSSTATLKLAIEEAIHKAAPEVEEIDAEGVVAAPASPLLQLETSDALREKRREAVWTELPAPGLASGQSALREIDGEQVLFLQLTQGLYAYRPRCPGCGESLAEGVLADGELACPACGRRYDVRHAGRSPDDAELHLYPVPLLHDGNGAVKVALGAPA
jgi:Fe-S cluster biogenesis protein NfuA/nitrite reductase/ring-hydroxylating ferredoxin subunit